MAYQHLGRCNAVVNKNSATGLQSCFLRRVWSVHTDQQREDAGTAQPHDASAPLLTADVRLNLAVPTSSPQHQPTAS